MPVVAHRLAAQRRDDVVAELLRLSHGVLRRRRGKGLRIRLRQVGHGRAVPRRPCVIDAEDLQCSRASQALLLVERQVGVLEQRMRAHSCGPHNRLGVELLARREHDMATDE